MKKNTKLTFQIAAVFIGTIVGAGLASGQEITQFFTVYGPISFVTIIICVFLYIIICKIIIYISLKYRLTSYDSFINKIDKSYMGYITHICTSFFLIASASIILAGSGSLLNQYFNISKWFGILIMSSLTLYTLLKDTNGLIKINSFIVPSLIFVITLTFILYISFSKNIPSTMELKAISINEDFWIISLLKKYNLNIFLIFIPFLSSILYGSFNILSCSGVLVPLSFEMKNKKVLDRGIILGAVGLTFLTLIINYLLLVNTPSIYKYEIPLLFILNRFGKPMQILLLVIIWMEMFSTEVSDIYSVGKTMENSLNIPYKMSVIIILAIAIPISQIGFVKLISILYPAFSLISFIFLVKCIIFYIKDKKG
ncbi:MAG: transporter [Clostridiaceae bacterium]